MPSRVYVTKQFQEEVRTLPVPLFSGGIELPENKIIGVKMYDLGGVVHYRPALYLIQLANQTVTKVYKILGEIAGYGLSFGMGMILGAGAKGVSLGAKVLKWVDRIGTVIGVLNTVIQEHRGWIISRFGESGKSFLKCMEYIDSAFAIFGLVKTMKDIGTLAYLQTSYGKMRNAIKGMRDLDPDEIRLANQIQSKTDDLIEEFKAKVPTERVSPKTRDITAKVDEHPTGRRAPKEAPEEGIPLPEISEGMEMEIVPTAQPPTPDVEVKRIRGYTSHRAKPGRRVRSKTRKELEADGIKQTAAAPTKDVKAKRTQEEQLHLIDFSLRAKTPNDDLRRWARGELPEGSVDPIFPNRIVKGPAEPDHIVPFEVIRKMEGFAALDTRRQLEVLNWKENFAAVSGHANKSRQMKSFRGWRNMLIRKERDFDDSALHRLILKEGKLPHKIQSKINRLLKEQLNEQ